MGNWIQETVAKMRKKTLISKVSNKKVVKKVSGLPKNKSVIAK